MEELYAEHEGIQVCPVCQMDVPNLAEAIKHIDPHNQEVFFFDTEGCYKEFIENPELFAVVDEETEVE